MALKQLETTRVTVGDYRFHLKPFPAFYAANMTGELASVLAPVMIALTPLAGDKEDPMDVDVTQAAQAIAGCQNLSGDKVQLLMEKLLLGNHIIVDIPDEKGNIEPEPLTLDVANEIFCGDVQDMFILCFHVIRLNFKGFFKRLSGLYGARRSAATTPEAEKMETPVIMRPII